MRLPRRQRKQNKRLKRQKRIMIRVKLMEVCHRHQVFKLSHNLQFLRLIKAVASLWNDQYRQFKTNLPHKTCRWKNLLKLVSKKIRYLKLPLTPKRLSRPSCATLQRTRKFLTSGVVTLSYLRKCSLKTVTFKSPISIFHPYAYQPWLNETRNSDPALNVSIRKFAKIIYIGQVMDCRKLNFADETFDLIIDKATSDSLLCGSKAFRNLAVTLREC